MRIAPRVLLVEPFHIDDVRDARDVAAPIAVLFPATRFVVPIQDLTNILDMLDGG